MVVVKQALIMAMLILLGLGCYKGKVITKDVNKSLSTLVLMIANPVVIFVSYQTPFNKELLNGLLQSFVLAGVCFAISIIISMVFVKNKDKGQQAIERFSCVYSNCGFMGIPLVQGLYGGEGVLYLTSFMTVFNVLVWTHGLIIMKGDGKFNLRSLKNAVTSPAVIATVIGLILFLLNIILPDILLQTLKYVGNLNTPLAMIVAGATIAQTNLKEALKKVKIYVICFLKLIALPLLLIFVLKLFKYNDIVTGTSILAVACPTATTGTLFAIRYNKDSLYASEIFAVTTIISMVTLPIIMVLFDRII